MPPLNLQHAINQPVSAMCKNDLQALCQHFELDDNGPVTALRQCLKNYLQNNCRQLKNNPIYSRLYPHQGRQNPQPAHDPDDHEDDPDNGQDQNTQQNPGTPPPSDNADWHGLNQPEGDIADNNSDVHPLSNHSRLPSAIPVAPSLSRTPATEDVFPGQERLWSPSFSMYTPSPPFSTLWN